MMDSPVIHPYSTRKPRRWPITKVYIFDSICKRGNYPLQ
jgi:hypothetical protein